MPFKIVRNDITGMDTEAIVNTANKDTIVSDGCDTAIYKAAGFEQLLNYRKEHIGRVEEGEVFITPGYDLKAEYIIHAVSPLFIDGRSGEEEKLRSCYRKSLELAAEKHIRSISFPLISTGSFGYPKEEGMRIAADEINAFLLHSDMLIYLVVFDDAATTLGKKLYPDLDSYIDRNYVETRQEEEYTQARPRLAADLKVRNYGRKDPRETVAKMQAMLLEASTFEEEEEEEDADEAAIFAEKHEDRLNERIKHLSDTFSEYLLYLISSKHMNNSDVWKRAIVDKKVFSKIKNNPAYHPQKITALCLCIGAQLNMDEAKDLLARAGYALSPCDKTDIIFSYFIENRIYDMIELDIQLEEHGEHCIIA